MRTNRFLLVIYSITIIETIVLYYIFGIQGGGDTSGYIEAWENFSHGEIDYYRTPVYPIILGISRLFSEKAPYLLVLLFQSIVYLYSICCFNKITLIYFNNSKTAIIITAIYGLFPIFVSWNITLLTESLALSGFVIFLFCFVNTTLRESKSYKMLVAAIILMVLLSFLRPSFMILIVIVAIIWLLQWYKYRQSRKYYSVGIGCLLMACLSFHCYMNSYKLSYGIYATSSVGLINQYYMAREYGYIKPKVFRDSHIRSYVENACASKHSINSEDLFEESFLLFDAHRNQSDILKNGIETSISQNKLSWLKGYYKRIKKGLKCYICNSRITPVSTIFSAFSINFHTLLFLLGIYALLIIHSLLSSGWPILSISLFLIISLFFLMISFGAQTEWGRLFIPVSPCVIFFVGKLFEILSISRIVINK